MYEIKTPGNPNFTGIRCGTAIVNGVGRTPDREVARELLALGYEVTPDPSKATEKK